jgi:hypothetical protein
MNRQPQFIKQFRQTVSGIVNDAQQIRIIARDAGFDVSHFNFNQAAESVWHSVMEEAFAQEMVPDLFQELRGRYPRNTDIAQLYDEFLAEPSQSSDPDLSLPDSAPITIEELEALTGPVPTFLPAAFLHAGWLASQSVVRIRTPVRTGTGFLVRRDRLLTCHHILPTPELARGSQIDFDYETEIDGAFTTHTSCGLDPSVFQTSPKDDLSLVGFDPLAELHRLPIVLADEQVRVGDRVAIVQHAGGGRKQVALHRSLVRGVDDRFLHYMTDTLPGSSGSPVFDTRWRVVGIHRGEGRGVEPNSGRIVFRNVGTSLPAVDTCLKEWGVISQARTRESR